MILIQRTDSSDSHFIALTDRLNEFLAVLNGEKHAFYSQYNRQDSLSTVVVAFRDDEPIGCGAFRSVDHETVEIKRMFVSPDVRGNGFGAQVLRELEIWAAEHGYSKAILETSRRLEPAVRLYSRSEYAVIPNYGPYVDVTDSVCMAKRLSQKQ